MLVALEIKDFALIESARVEFAPGLNVLTGETGVGKSLLLSALTFVLGEKAAASNLRAGTSETEVSALFVVRGPELARAVEETTGIPAGEDGELLLRRTFSATGQSRAWENGRPVTLALLKSLGEHLLDIHGQHEHQSLLSPYPQLAVLDRFAGVDAEREAFTSLWREREERRRTRAELAAGEATRKERLEVLRANLEEIRAAALQPGEVEALEREKRVLANAEKLAAAVQAAWGALYEAEGSAVERVHAAQVELDRAAGMDGELGATATALREAGAALREVASDVERYAERLRSDPHRREEVEDRLYAIRRLLSRFGPTPEAALAHGEELERQVAELSASDNRRAGLDGELAELGERLRVAGGELSRRRREAAAELERGVTRGLRQLAMPEAKFQVAFEPAGSGGAPGATTAEAGLGGVGAAGGSATGFERVEFTIAPNPGEPPKPLRRIASGGELSRTMLAVKRVLAESDRIPVLVFDEVDANVGGRLGAVLARELREIARTHQVLCVTHLPQIAAAAHRHVHVSKEVVGGRTQTTFAPLEGRARVLEIGEMLEGRPPSPTSIREAEVLLARLGADATEGKRAGARVRAKSPAKTSAAVPGPRRTPRDRASGGPSQPK
ncbi:MAG: DNA repair protein RecN [Planctomycetes bacterium]|nr:DNA repair protein RecN [Planctomycetota bacterium]